MLVTNVLRAAWQERHICPWRKEAPPLHSQSEWTAVAMFGRTGWRGSPAPDGRAGMNASMEPILMRWADYGYVQDRGWSLAWAQLSAAHHPSLSERGGGDAFTA